MSEEFEGQLRFGPFQMIKSLHSLFDLDQIKIEGNYLFIIKA
jgi:hypothetical protein